MAETAAPANVPMEAIGSETQAGPGAQTYEQITESLKRGEAGKAAPETPEAPEAETTTEAQATAPAKETPEAEEFRTMTDQEIAALPPELQQEAKALRKRFQAAYTKKTMDLAEIRRKAEFMDRFDSDPALQEQVVQQVLARRQQRGDQTPAGQPAQASAQTGPPPALVEMAKKSLPPEMQWMAESQANFGWQLIQAMQQNMIQPLQQNLSAIQQQRQEQEYTGVLNQFADANPGWEEKEDDMVDVLEFLKSPALTHPRWGRKHDLLYRLAQGEKAEETAVQKAVEKTAEKVKTRSITSRGAERGTTSNLEDRIRGAKSDREAWALIHQAGGR